MQRPKKLRPPKLKQHVNGSLFVEFYDPSQRQPRKRIFMGVVLPMMQDIDSEVPKDILSRFYTDYRDPYFHGRLDPWNMDLESKGIEMTWAEAVERYVARPGLSANTIRTDRTTLNEFRAFAVAGLLATSDDFSVHEVEAGWIDTFIHGKDVSDTYRGSLYTRLRAFFNWLVGEGVILESDNPVKTAKSAAAPDLAKPFLKPVQITKLVGAIQSDYDRRVINAGRKGGIMPGGVVWAIRPLLFGAATGMRPSEIKRLLVGHVDLEMGRLVVRSRRTSRTKNRSERVVPLCRLAERVVREAAVDRADADSLFTGATGGPFCARLLSRTVKAYLFGIGADPDVDLYGATRHSCASWLAMLGYPALTISSILGHRSLRVTEGYMHLAPNSMSRHLAENYRRFAAEAGEIGFFEPFVSFK